MEASRYQKPGVPYVADGPYSEKWAWVFFEAKVEVSHSAEIVAKAVIIFRSEFLGFFSCIYRALSFLF